MSLTPARDKLIAECTAHNLKPIFNRGAVGGPLCIAGEAPGADELRLSQPFIGASGREQDLMLDEVGVQPHEVWYTNAYKVKPPDTPLKTNDFSALESLGIPKAIYEAEFIEELNEKKPTIIVCTGASCLSVLCPDCRNYQGDVVISSWQGSLLTSPFLSYPHWIVGVQHPAFVLRQWSERQISVFIYGRALEELRFFQKHGHLQPLPTRELIHSPTYSEVMEYLYDLIHYPEKPRILTCDLELNPNKSKRLRWKYISLIGIGRSATSSLCIPLWDFETRQTAKILFALQECYDSHNMVNQNLLNFDGPWLLRSLGLEVDNRNMMQDTITRHHVLWPELPHSLQFQTMMYTREPYYKDEGKGVNLRSPADTMRWRKYNCLDTAITYEVFDAQEREFAERN